MEGCCLCPSLTGPLVVSTLFHLSVERALRTVAAPLPWPELVRMRNEKGMGCAGSTVTEPGSVCCGGSWAPRVMRREGSGQDSALVLPCPPPHYPDLLRCNELNHSTSLFHIRGDL